MTARTHDVSAFTGLLLAILYIKLPEISVGTMFVAIGANFLGGLFPDLDKPTSKFWQNIRGGSIFGRIISPFLGGHRHLTHSLIGLIITYLCLGYFLPLTSSVIRVDMDIIKWAFMIGMGSHLIIDALTAEGIPLFFPIKNNVGFPPIKFLRIRTNGFVEKYLFFRV